MVSKQQGCCCLLSWGVSKEPQAHTDHVLGFPLPPSHKAAASRVLGTHTSRLYPPPTGVTLPSGPVGARRRRWPSKEDLLLNARGFRGNNFPSS